MHPKLLIFLFLGFALGLTMGSAIATDRVSLDGQWWQSLDGNEKLRVVQGLYSGLQGGYVLGYLGGCKYARGSLRSPCVKAAIKGLRTADLTFETFIAHTDQIYNDHPKEIDTHLQIFAWCIFQSEGCDRFATADEH